MEDNKDKIDEEKNTCDCGCEKCGSDGCSEEDCKECDKECESTKEKCECGCGCEDKECDCGCGCSDEKDSVGANDDSAGASSTSPNEKDELTLANEKVKDWEDKYKRLLAEFDNFRKRSEKESAMMMDFGASMILTKILPVVDNFERAINSIPEDLKDNSFVDGVDKIYKQMLKTFEELGVKPIDAVGKPFDANLHNAVMTDENAEGEVDTVTEELQKGYMYKDQVLRHSMVKVKK